MSTSSSALAEFKNIVGIRFQLYNSLFTSLPFHRIEKTGILLSLLLTACEEGYTKKLSPVQIIEDFIARHTSYTKEEEKIDLLFRFVQYAERQVVLFDALEDAAFPLINDLKGPGTLNALEGQVNAPALRSKVADKLRDFSVRLVLTAHPTQFYPGPVLGIIHDLAEAISGNDAKLINTYLQQLGKTPFFKQQKPTPYDEAVSLLWYMENVFYSAAGKILTQLKNQLGDLLTEGNPVIRMGFWPGGDRDGNPFVTYETTMKVAGALRSAILRCYYRDVRRLKRRLTFKGVENEIAELEAELYENVFIPGHEMSLTTTRITEPLGRIRETLIYQHNGLFVELVDDLINKVQVFGLHFASLDIRQDSGMHGKALAEIAARTGLLPDGYERLGDKEKIDLLAGISSPADPGSIDDAIAKDTLQVMACMREIQSLNGELGCNRYIISHCTSVLNAMEVYGLLLLSGWKAEELKVDIVPLFETVDDLRAAATVMKELYALPAYAAHLKKRGQRQTIMLGFSDGTKDGGYLMANWSIYKAKEELTQISKQHGIDVVFFDGRGGPPARGGGKTHKFYASLGKNIANKEIQLTIQGQTVSSNFGTVDAARFNMEQLLHAGITNDLFPDNSKTFTAAEEALIRQLAEKSLDAYLQLRNHPSFLEYLGHASPLRFYAETNIASRPAKRSNSSRLSLKDLRAIPFVGAWTQLKQNVTGFYGVGTALRELEATGRFNELKELYKNSTFVKTLFDNCEMTMKKCFFPLTEFLSGHPKYGEIWKNIFDEYERTSKYVLQLSGKSELMADYPVEQLSVQMRERIVLPINTIQQYAITRVREMEENLIQPPLKATLEKLVMRCSFGIINAGRNSV